MFIILVDIRISHHSKVSAFLYFLSSQLLGIDTPKFKLELSSFVASRTDLVSQSIYLGFSQNSNCPVSGDLPFRKIDPKEFMPQPITVERILSPSSDRSNFSGASGPKFSLFNNRYVVIPLQQQVCRYEFIIMSFPLNSI